MEELTKEIQQTESDYTDVEAARAFFASDRFAMSTTGIEIIAVNKNYAKCCLKLDERHGNAAGAVMGGAIYTLADFTFAVATNFRQPPTVTMVSQISYLSTAKGTTLFCESRLIKDGKRNCFFEFLITDELGTSVALVSTTGAHLGK